MNFQHSNNQGSSAKLVLSAILGKQRAWREIQNLYMKILKVRNPLNIYWFEGTLYVIALLAWIMES